MFEAHKDQGGVTALAATKDCQNLITASNKGEVKLWAIGKQTQKLITSGYQHKKKITCLELIMND